MRWREWIMLGLRVLSIFVADWYGGQNIRANAIDPHQFAHPVGFVRVRPPRPTAPAPAGAGGARARRAGHQRGVPHDAALHLHRAPRPPAP